jgi:hypothetical protein
VEDAVMRALQKDPAARFQTVGDFSRALDAGAKAAPTPPSRPAEGSPTLSRTAVNPALGAGRAAPASGAARPAAKDLAGAATMVRPAPAAAARRKLPRLNRRAGAVVLALSALAAGALVLLSGKVPRPVLSGLPAQPVVPRAAAPAESVAVAPAVQQPPPPPAQVAAVVPRTLTIVPLGSDGHFKPGERVRLQVVASHDAHVYCYLQDESRRIVRFYPNRFRQSALVTAAAPLEIPGPMRFEILANAHKVTETIACFASEREVLGQLPPEVVGTDFAKLPLDSLDEVRSAFVRAGADPLAEASFQVRFK